ncbi:iron-containing alcohol dehydrogenase [Cohnella sp. AR92]|uniref:iron-containing alcohol dehydrogenase n=1 Tax=Cohnella sp. AR92 TaxID=648716 RepID=UPI000F8EA477|nr:iron-containing alcohol dehydrogenase [Cohnella sp. AR92]RUS45722.1 iron-containing alcohol dehydrogenase [Cohnella sp. AR92]
MYKLYCRLYQSALRLFSRFMPWREPEILEGEGSLRLLPALIQQRRIGRVLLVTDQGIRAVGLMDKLLEGLDNAKIAYFIYDGTVPNPTVDNVEEALEIYLRNDCSGIIAFGGGSPMDCAKGVGARIARPNKSVARMRGILKVRRAIPPLFAIPTTSGTGSEATLAAVISNSRTHEKFAINDHSLIPHYAVLDPALTYGLPPAITSTTGVDALTHAVEAYIGRSNTKQTRQRSREAVSLIFGNLLEAYRNGDNREARANMQKASYLAGFAFTRAYVGYVHAIAHTLGGFYSVPHGLANAVILPYVLDYYGASAHKPLAELADLIGIGDPADTTERKATKFIEAIRMLNEDMDIPRKIAGIADKDIPVMVERAYREANPLYPVPRILSRSDLTKLYERIKA